MSRAVRRGLGVLLSVTVVAALLAACAPTHEGTRIETTSDVALTAAYLEDDDPIVDRLSSAGMEVNTMDRMMLRPVDLTSDDPHGGEIILRATLPAELPTDAIARFAYFDEESDSWASVPSTVTGTTITAATTHLSLWTIVVSFTDAAAATVTGAWDDAGAQWAEVGDRFGEAWSAWSTLGPGSWIYRNAGLALGLQAEAPTCEGDIYTEPALEWVDTALIPQLTDVPPENQSVLRCVGVDPEDPSRVQAKAVANRGFGFRVEFADGVAPPTQWSLLGNLATADTAALFDVISDSTANASTTDPVDVFREFLVGTTEVSFSVSEADARTAQASGQRLVSFVRPDELQMAMSVAVKLLVDGLEGAVGQEVAAVGVLLGLRECIGENLPGDWGNAALASQWISGCFQGLADEDFFAAVDRVTTKLSQDPQAGASPVLSRIFGAEDSRKLFGKVLHALKWIDVVALALTMTDYWGERTDNPWWIDITATAPDFSTYDGTWCNIYDECALTITAPDVTVSAPTTFSTTKPYAGRYTMTVPTTLIGGSAGCEEIATTGRDDGVVAIVACPKGVPYTGTGLPNCGCGLESAEEVRARYVGEEHLYLLTRSFGSLYVEPFARAA